MFNKHDLNKGEEFIADDSMKSNLVKDVKKNYVPLIALAGFFLILFVGMYMIVDKRLAKSDALVQQLSSDIVAIAELQSKQSAELSKVADNLVKLMEVKVAKVESRVDKIEAEIASIKNGDFITAMSEETKAKLREALGFPNYKESREKAVVEVKEKASDNSLDMSKASDGKDLDFVVVEITKPNEVKIWIEGQLRTLDIDKYGIKNRYTFRLTDIKEQVVAVYDSELKEYMLIKACGDKNLKKVLKERGLI